MKPYQLLLVASSLSVGLGTTALACNSNPGDCLPRAEKEYPAAAEFEADINTKHPFIFCELAIAQFHEGNQNIAIRSHYVCQIRWRIWLTTGAKPEPGGDLALLGAHTYQMNQVLSRIFEFDRQGWRDAIHDAINWHQSNDYAFQNYAHYPEAEARVISSIRSAADDLISTDTE